MGRIFAAKLSAGGDFLEGDPIMGSDYLWGRQYFNKGETYLFCDYFSTGGPFMGRHFNVTTAPALVRSC